MRKTVEVAKVLSMANAFMANSGDHEDVERRGVASLLESVLHETGNYHGFCYVKKGGRVTAFVVGETDESRRCYYSTK